MKSRCTVGVPSVASVAGVDGVDGVASTEGVAVIVVYQR